MLREQEHRTWDVLRIHACTKEINRVYYLTAQYLRDSRRYLHTEIHQYLLGFTHVEGIELFIHKIVLNCNSGLIQEGLCNLISCRP